MTEPDAVLRDIESIVHRRDPSRTADLVAWLDDHDDGRVAWAAAWALGRLGASLAVPALESLLRRGIPNVSSAAAEALLRIGPDEVRARTVAHLMTQGLPIDILLGGYHTRHPLAVPFVEAYHDSADARIREQARRFVARHAEPEPPRRPTKPATPGEIATWLEDVADGDAHRVVKSANRLAQCPSLPPGAAAVLAPALTAWRDDDLHDTRGALAVALARTGDPDAAAPILRLLDGMEVRTAAVQALEILLEAAAARIPDDALREVAGLPDELLDCWDLYDINWGSHRGIHAVDLTRVKALADAELARRGTA